MKLKNIIVNLGTGLNISPTGQVQTNVGVTASSNVENSADITLNNTASSENNVRLIAGEHISVSVEEKMKLPFPEQTQTQKSNLWIVKMER